ncbi:MAG: TIGR04283 family arsenosugar biosynthesis glycosyltransferase [Parvibaculum sp.]|uniref:TIGR04283 family arsenosugar biosynthesis glycosyltransferase n=1 Tax=Parvibaculum sp. TaxID=2024848 RepID=UPI003C78A1EA
MLSVIIPTLNAEATLPRVLTALIPAAVHGVVREVIIADGGSTDGTAEIVEATGAKFIHAPRGRGSQLAAGAKAAKSSWLLFLHADTVLEQGWDREVEKLLEHVAAGRFRSPEIAATFRFTLDDFSGSARFLERVVAYRCALLKLPYGDQGLIVNKRLYDRIGGFRDLPLMEDVDLVRRIGRRRMVLLRSRAVTSPERYLKDGFATRMARNALCITLYYLRVPPRFIARIYA